MSSWKIAGIKVSIHPLFWLVSVAAALTGQFQELITLFGLVVMHELGHVFAALAVGWRVKSMELLPFGGVCEVDEWGSTKARDEIAVALAGPFVNGAMILVGLLFVWIGAWDQAWAEFFIQGNAAIACFNLLPIWPLDGGKILQAVLSKMISYYKTIYASIAWSVFSIILLLACSSFLSFRWNLIAICAYLLIENRMAWKRAHYQFLRFLLMKKGKQNHQWMGYQRITCGLEASAKVNEAVKLLKKECYHCFHILDERKKTIAKLPEDKLLHAFFEKNPQRTISELLAIG